MDTADVTPASRTEEEDETGSSLQGEDVRRLEWPPLVTRLLLTLTLPPLLPLWTATAQLRLLETMTTMAMRDQLLTAMALLLMTAMALPLRSLMALQLTPLCMRPLRREGEVAQGSELTAAPLLGPPPGTGEAQAGAGADPLPGDPPRPRELADSSDPRLPPPRGDLLRGSRDPSSPGEAVV